MSSFRDSLSVVRLGRKCHCSLQPMFSVHFGEKDGSFRYVVPVSSSGVLDVLTDPPTSSTVDTAEGFLFAMCRAECKTCER